MATLADLQEKKEALGNIRGMLRKGSAQSGVSVDVEGGHDRGDPEVATMIHPQHDIGGVSEATRPHHQHAPTPAAKLTHADQTSMPPAAEHGSPPVGGHASKVSRGSGSVDHRSPREGGDFGSGHNKYTPPSGGHPAEPMHGFSGAGKGVADSSHSVTHEADQADGAGRPGAGHGTDGNYEGSGHKDLADHILTHVKKYRAP